MARQENGQTGAIVLLSGGLDSTTMLAMAVEQGYRIHTLSFDYGQKNRFELARAGVIATAYKVAEHRTVTIDLRAFGGSSLTSDQEVERRTIEEIGHNIPSTYVPVRNTLFLTYALAWAEVLKLTDIFIGVNALDTSGYPDCRPEFIDAFNRLANVATVLGTEMGRKISIHAPLQELNKCQIIRAGLELGVDYSLTNTCYDPTDQGAACGTCDACVLRKKGFAEAGLADPIVYKQ